MIAFIDPTRAAQLEEAVVTQSVLIAKLTTRIEHIECKLITDIMKLEEKVSKLDNRSDDFMDYVRRVPTYEMSSLKEEPKTRRQSTRSVLSPTAGVQSYYGRDVDVNHPFSLEGIPVFKYDEQVNTDWYYTKQVIDEKADKLSAAWAAHWTPDA